MLKYSYNIIVTNNYVRGWLYGGFVPGWNFDSVYQVEKKIAIVWKISTWVENRLSGNMEDGRVISWGIGMGM